MHRSSRCGFHYGYSLSNVSLLLELLGLAGIHRSRQRGEDAIVDDGLLALTAQGVANKLAKDRAYRLVLLTNDEYVYRTAQRVFFRGYAPQSPGAVRAARMQHQ